MGNNSGEADTDEMKLVNINFCSHAQSRTCFRCEEIGLGEHTILPFERHARIEDDEGKVSFACLDCYQRLTDEITDSERFI